MLVFTAALLSMAAPTASPLATAYQRAETALRTDHLGEAASAINELIAGHRTTGVDPDIAILLAQYQFEQRDPGGAAATLRTVDIDKVPARRRLEVLSVLAASLEYSGELERAAESYQLVLAEAPSNSSERDRALRGLARTQLGQNPAAAMEYAASLPDSGQALGNARC